MIRLALIFLLAGPAAAQEPAMRVENPHGYGWWLGDVLVQRIHLDLPQGVGIEPATLPRPRAVDYWLDLRDLQLEETDSGITLTLEWQNFYSALEPQAREVPGASLRLTDGRQVALPGFRFVTSPIRPLMAPSIESELLPDPPYHLVPTRPNRIALSLSLLALLISATVLAWHQAWGPFRQRPDRPFTRAARQIARHPEQGRKLLHRAFDTSFGRVLIGAELPEFLNKRPEFAPLSDRLESFFRESDGAYFGNHTPGPSVEIDQLTRDLALIERGMR